jgi:hypothetical protein
MKRKKGAPSPGFDRSICVAGLILLIGVGAVALYPPRSSAIEIPIIAYILNAGPEAITVTLRDGEGDPVSHVDPGVAFSAEFECRDNNTAEDIASLALVVYSHRSTPGAADSDSDHYTFRWLNSSGFEGRGLNAASCDEPSDLSGAGGTWVFDFTLDRTAVAGTWYVRATVADEAETDNIQRGFTVTKYLSASLSTTQVSLLGAPGTTVATEVSAIYTCNHPIELGARATDFVGVTDPSFSLGPERFSIDDDDSPDSPEEGLDMIQLSSSRQAFAGGLQGSGELPMFVFVSIPDPFLDQDYQGHLIFDVRSM